MTHSSHAGPALWLKADAARRLGAVAVARIAWHRSPLGAAVARRRLAPAAPPGALTLPAPGPAPALTAAHRAQVLNAARQVATPPKPADTATVALRLDPLGGEDIRPLWERNRWAELPLLAQAACLDPAGGHAGRAAAFLRDWSAANPAYRGPNWACGQEASLRLLHLATALAMLGARAPLPGVAALVALHARRIEATPAYALAQDNNHAVSEAAGLLVTGLLLRDPARVALGATRLDRTLCRLIAPCGAFAQLSTGYHRLLLDVVAIAEWLRRRHDGPPLAAAARAGMAAATEWLHRLTDPATGATPRLGHQDGSCFADLSLAGPDDARASVERAARLFADRGAGRADDPGCAWIGLAAPRADLPAPPAAWSGAGVSLRRSCRARALLRTGPLRYRPGHADLLHLDLWDGPRNLLRDAGTGAYNAGGADAWWHQHFTGTRAHNTVAFDEADQMPRAGRFLFGRWPRTGTLPDGAWYRDHAGRRHERRVGVDGRTWTVEDQVGGRFGMATLRWHLGEGAWVAREDGVDGPARIGIQADAPIAIAVEAGWHSPAYGEVRPCQLLVARARAPVTRFTTRIALPA